MFKVEMAKVGATVEYLAQSEQEQANFAVDFNNPNVKEFLVKQNIKPEGYTLEYRAKYLEQENPHYKAQMLGGLAKEWGLTEYTRENYVDLISGKFPKAGIKPNNIKKNGNIITVRQNAQAGLDTLANGPKTVSIEFARGSKEKRDLIQQCYAKSIEGMMEQIATQVKPSCQDKKYQDFEPSKTKIIATSFTHYENRGYEEDGEWRLEPNLHNHISIANYAEFELYVHDENGNRIKDPNGEYKTEKKIFAINAENIFKQQLENSAVFDTLLNSNLQKAGFKTEPCEVGNLKTFRIAGYTREMEESLSVRTKNIDTYVEEQKAKGIVFSSETHAVIEYKKSLRKNTAKTKHFHDTSEILQNIQETVNKNISAEDQKRIDILQATVQQKSFEPDFLSITKTPLFETAGVVEETKIRALLVQELRFTKGFNSIKELNDEVDRAFNSLTSIENGKFALVKMDDGRYTRLDIVANEKALQNNIETLKRLSKPLLENQKQADEDFLADFYRENKRKGFKLNKGQFEACKSLLQESNVSMVVGDAGTGKTTSVIRFANEYYSSKKMTVYGLSVATSQSRDLKDANIPKENCLNSKEFIQKAFEKKTGKIKPSFLKANLNSVFIFDEAGMSGSEDMKKITDFVKAVNQSGGESKLVLVGDHKQLQAVSYGNAFTNIQEQLNQKDIARLDENTRQKNPIAKAIAEGYKNKDIELVFSTLKENNLLITEKKQEQVIERLVDDYLNDPSKSKLIICGLNEEIDKVNDLARKGVIKQEKEKIKSNPAYKSQLDFANSKSIAVARTSGNGNEFVQNRSFCKGEEIVFLKNLKKPKEGWEISNSDRGTIEKIKKLSKDNYQLTVDINGKKIIFETAEYNKFNHCYAVSTHKSQGKTVENAYHLGNPNMARFQNSYVNGSRHKDQYKLYLAEDQVNLYKKNSVREAVKETTLNDDNCKKALEQFTYKEITKKRTLPAPIPDFKHKIIDRNSHLKTAQKVGRKLKIEQANRFLKEQAEEEKKRKEQADKKQESR